MGNSTEIARHDPYGFLLKAQINAEKLVITAASAATMGASRTSMLRLQRSRIVPYSFSFRNRNFPISGNASARKDKRSIPICRMGRYPKKYARPVRTARTRVTSRVG